jgi:cell division protein FtsQ
LFRPRLPRIPGAASWVLAGLAFGALFVSLSFALLYGYRFFTRNAYFTLKSIVIEGTFRLTSREVLEIAGVRPEGNSLNLSIDGMERRLSQNPWVENVSVRRSLPDSLRIAVREREPRFWVRREGQLCYADIYGNVIAPLVIPAADDARSFPSCPILEVDRGAGAMTALLPELARALTGERLPVSMADVSLIRLSHGRGVELVLDRSRLVISLGPENLQANLTRLGATLADLVRRGELARVREVRAHGPNVWVVRDGPAAALFRSEGKLFA